MKSISNYIWQRGIKVPVDIVEDYQPVWGLKSHAINSGNQLDGHEKPPVAQVLHCLNDEGIGSDTQGLFHEMYERLVDDLGYFGSRKSIAVEYSDQSCSHADLEKLANRIAHYLQTDGVKCNDRIGLLFDRSLYCYASMLAVMKAGAAFVPLDAGFPVDRIEYMLADSGATRVLTLSCYVGLFDAVDCKAIALDAEFDVVVSMSDKRVKLPAPLSVDSLCYVIYTSGSSGKPKGVPITHANISGFLNIAKHCYGYKPSDRVYQALTPAFDYSVEEIWVPLLCGASLVPAPVEGNLVGDDLADFINTNNITALCCVPTLLATIEKALPQLRFLMVSGEACPQVLVDKWASHERRFLNTYGPTETTVTATWKIIQPGTVVSIGGPLPGYSVMILRPDSAVAVNPGESGEIAIAGIGTSNGYLNLPQQTAKVFIDDFVGIDNNPTAKIYRTGDLGLINQNSEIEYLGRIDSQIKIRGYRIELGEIESCLGSIDELEEVVVCAHQTDADQQELVAYFTTRPGKDEIAVDEIQRVLQQVLPVYMVPAFYQKLDTMPHLPSGKIDRKSLPAPVVQRLLTSGKAYCAPETEVQRQLADLLAAVLKTDRISINDDFFDDLAANSLLMAKYVTRIRRTLSVKGISLKKIYQNSTIALLAIVAQEQLLKSAPNTALCRGSVNSELSGGAEVPTELYTSTDSAVGKHGALVDDSGSSIRSGNPNKQLSTGDSDVTGLKGRSNDHAYTRVNSTVVQRSQKAQAIWCGLIQCLVLASYIFLFSLASVFAFDWMSNASNSYGIYTRALIGGSSLFFGTTGVLILVKWLAIGRFRVEKFPVWSSRYIRFWIARTAVLANPLNMFRGTPVYNIFLRCLGVTVGSQAILFCRPPVCCDLVTIERNTVIREDVYITGYSAESGAIRTGTVEVGEHCYVGEAAVLEINTRMGNHAQLGYASALLEHQVIPPRQSFHGSPAELANTDFVRLPLLPNSVVRNILYGLFRLLAYVMIPLPLFASVLILLNYHAILPVADNTASYSSQWVGLSGLAALLYLAGICIALVRVLVVPRLIRMVMQEEKVHPVYGLQFFLGQAMNRFSNSRLLNWLFGDSSMILHYLSAIGYDMKSATQTGSNFGVDQRQHSPFLCRFGRNTLVSDRLRMTNMMVSNSSYKISQISVPANMYLGNALHYPVGARLAENCLIGTKTMIPIDGPLQSNTGLLGSPAFAIPRSVASDHKFDHYLEPAILRQRLRQKLKSNLVTLAFYMTKSWLQIFLMLFIAWFGTSIYQAIASPNSVLIALISTTVVVADIVAVLLFSIFCERLAQGFRPLKPLYCSLYDRRFWRHERFWKMNSNLLLELFNGTPVKPVFNRLRGVRIGANMFDDGVAIVEHDLVKIGDNCTCNVNSVMQSHSLEDGTFKSDHIEIGNGCNFGVGAFIHYGTLIQDRCTVLADSFVMKGTVTGGGTTWGGNPACELVADESEPVDGELRDYPEQEKTVNGAVVGSVNSEAVTG